MSAGAQRPILGHLHTPDISTLGWRKALLACGILFPALWVGMDVVASLAYDGYSYADQTVSELSAVGAPTRTFWMVFGSVDGILAIAFAMGIWQSASRSRALRLVAALIAAHAIFNLAVGPFSSMHQREVLAADGATLSDTLHLVVVAVGGVIFLIETAFAAPAFGRWFRLYSIATVLVVLVMGFITSSYASEVQDNEATPLVGIYERISAYGYQLWIAVLAIALLRRAALDEAHSTGGDR
jgi:hypothetical protein